MKRRRFVARKCRTLVLWVDFLKGSQMGMGWSLRSGDVILAKGGEERVVLAWVDRVILKKIIFEMIARDDFQQVNYPQSFSARVWWH